MNLAIMQPYFLPYIGYYQLIAAVDVFVVYDNIKYTKKGWINRNRMLQNGKDVMFSLPLKSGSDSLNICQRELATDFQPEKLLNQLRGAYARAPHFQQTYDLLERIITHEEANLFRFLLHSITTVCAHLGLTTQIRISSDIAIDHALKSQDKVLALCNAQQANTYVNSIGGIDLYSKEVFQGQSLRLKFLQSKPLEYLQWGQAFVPWLSMADVMMFNSLESIQSHLLPNYELI